MALTLHFHPLSSFCWKVLIALYESRIDFTPQVVDFGDAGSREAFFKLWPIGKMPVLEDDEAGLVVPESTAILDHLAGRFASARWLLPADPAAAREVRLQDRLYDQYIHHPMQKIVTDRLRPPESRDAFGVADARRLLDTALDLMEARLPDPASFTMADCAAAPALFYADKVAPFGASHPGLTRYLGSLTVRPSIARVLREAEPFFQYLPRED